MNQISKVKKDCLIFSDRRKIINVSENKRKFMGNNKLGKLFSNYRVDDCLIKEGRKCDFLLVNCEEKKVYFIELKGQDLISAVEQIGNSIKILKANLSDYEVNGRIVLTKVNAPDLRNSKYIKLERDLKKMNGTLLKGAKIFNEEL